MHLLVSRNAIDAPFVEIDDRACFAELLVCRKRVGEELDRERIEVEMRNAGSGACSGVIAGATMGTSCIMFLRSGMRCLYV